MSSSYDYLEFVLDQLSGLDNIDYRYMFGSFAIYYRGKVAGFIINDRLLIKNVPSAAFMMPEAEKIPPFKGGKPMILVEDLLEDRDFMKILFEGMYDELSFPKPKKRKVRNKKQSSM